MKWDNREFPIYPMKHNTSISLCGIVMIELVEKEIGVFSKLFAGIDGKANNFTGCQIAGL